MCHFGVLLRYFGLINKLIKNNNCFMGNPRRSGVCYVVTTYMPIMLYFSRNGIKFIRLVSE